MMTTFRPWFIADWLDVVFIHLRVPADALQPSVPLELDRFDRQAYVSLVAFTQARLRPAIAGVVGRAAKLVTSPIARHEFLNCRTYVRHAGGARGIYFVAEWIPNRLAALIGPRTYGLPYRVGRIAYHRDAQQGLLSGDVRALHEPAAHVAFSGSYDATLPRPATHGDLDYFLAERYTAFTYRKGVLRRFGVAHAPWRLRQVELDRFTATLAGLGAWTRAATVASCACSPGVTDVQIGGPERIAARARLAIGV